MIFSLAHTLVKKQRCWVLVAQIAGHLAIASDNVAADARIDTRRTCLEDCHKETEKAQKTAKILVVLCFPVFVSGKRTVNERHISLDRVFVIAALLNLSPQSAILLTSQFI